MSGFRAQNGYAESMDHELTEVDSDQGFPALIGRINRSEQKVLAYSSDH